MRCLSPLLSAALALAATGCPVGASRPSTAPRIQPGDPLPEVQGRYLTGSGPRSVADARGRVLIVDFWATFCDPCRRSFPGYEALHQQGVAIIAVALDDPGDVGDATIEAFVRETGATFTVLWDERQVSLSTFGVPKMPTAYVIDKTGVLRHVHRGYEAATLDEIQREVAALLEEP